MGEVQMWAASLRLIKCVGGYDERQHGVGGWAVGVSRDTQGWVMGCGKRTHLLSHLLPRRLSAASRRAFSAAAFSAAAFSAAAFSRLA